MLGLLSRPVVLVLLSPEFARAITLIWIMIPGIFLRAISKVLMPYFTGTDRPAVCSWAVGAGMAANIAAILFLLPIMGLSGAAWAMTIGFVVSSLILAVAFRRASGLSYVQTWMPRRHDIVTIVELARSVLDRLSVRRA